MQFLKAADWTTRGSSFPPQAGLRCIKPSGRGGLQAGKEQAPSLPYRASPSCHPDAAQTHLGLWTQLRNHNQAHGAQALHAGLSVPRGPFEA